MMLWALRRLEADPAVTFSEGELRRLDPGAFNTLRAHGVFDLMLNADFVSARVVDGRLMTVAFDADGEASAFDPDTPDEPASPIDDEDLLRWKPNRLRIAQSIAERNSLSGSAEEITPRLVYAGRTRANVAVTLGLFPSIRVALEAVVSLPSLVSGGSPTGHVVLLPSLEPSHAMHNVLRTLQITTARFASDDLAVDLPGLNVVSSGTEGRPAFRHSASFRWLEVDGVEHVQSMNQAMVLARLHEIGEPVSEAAVLEEFADDIASKRFADVFKNSPLLGTFIVPIGKGIFELKYY